MGILERFKGKVCLVTGGARGIGAAISYRLGSEGCSVVLADIDYEAGTIREKNLKEKGIDAYFFGADVSNEKDVENLMNFAGNLKGKIDVLINNAGIPFSGDELEKQTSEEFMKIIRTNLFGPWICSKYALKYMTNGGVIINIASTRAYQSEENTEPYSASKGGADKSKYFILYLSISENS